MDLAAVYADLDRVAWPELGHAYGPADDVPGLLRAMTGADEEAAAEAEQELWSSIVTANGARRIVGSGIQTEIIHNASEFRVVARRVLADLAH
ncbi:hypothetical protein [Streptomyces sp. NPDC001450]